MVIGGEGPLKVNLNEPIDAQVIKQRTMRKLRIAGMMAFGLVANVHAVNLSENETDVRNLHQKNFTG